MPRARRWAPSYGETVGLLPGRQCKCQHGALAREPGSWRVGPADDVTVSDGWVFAGKGAWGVVVCCRACRVAIKRFKGEEEDGPRVWAATVEKEVNVLMARRLAHRGWKHRYVVPFLGYIPRQPRSATGRGARRRHKVAALVFGYAGTDLHTWLKSAPHANYLRWWWVEIFLQLALALEFVHKCGILHADVKPGNILVEKLRKKLRGPIARMGDFGLAGQPDDYDADHPPCTLWYRPPEVLVGGRPGTAVDMWALGCTLVELMTGTPTFPVHPLQKSRVENNRLLRELHAQWKLPTTKDVPAGCHSSGIYVEVVAGLLNPNPEQRWTASRLARVLRPHAVEIEVTQAVRNVRARDGTAGGGKRVRV